MQLRLPTMHFALIFFPWLSSALHHGQAVFAAKQQQYSILTEAVDEFIAKVLAEWNSPAGVSVAVVQKKEDGSWLTETKGYGVANAAGDKVDSDTLFAIGSNSKLFTAIAAGLLTANTSLTPAISWNTKLASVLPDYGLVDSYASAETMIKDAMSHRTGLPRHDFMYGKNETVPDILKRTKHLKMSAPFRDIYQYCNIMYAVLAELPPALVGITFEDYVKTHIFDRLGMNSTTYSYKVANSSGHLANGFGREGVNKSEDLFGKGKPHAMEYWNREGEGTNFISGPGGVITSANDIAIWLKTLLLGGVNPATNDVIIPAEVIQTVSSGISVALPFGTPELSPAVYGAGQTQYSYRGNSIIEHGGGTPGFLTQVSRLPFSNFGIAVFSNDDQFGTVLHEIIKYHIIDTYFNLTPPVDWNARLRQALQLVFDATTQAITPPPAEKDTKPPSAGWDAISGVYEDQGYGQVELCSLSPNSTSARESSSCQDLLADLPTVLPGVDSDRPAFIISIDRLFASHLLLKHFDGDVFNISAYDSRRIIDDRSQSFWAAELTDGAPVQYLATFSKTASGGFGFGLTGNCWGGAPGLAPSGDTPEERAEVWFEKIKA